MIPVDKLTEKNIEKRFGILPPALKKALTSDANQKMALRICQDNQINNEEEILIVQQLAALVILGFLHPDDLGDEINDELALGDPQRADAIAEDFNAKLFSPLRSDLDENYKPLSGTVSKPAPAVFAPQKNSKPFVVDTFSAPPTAPKKDESDKGWSKARSTTTVVATDVSRPASFANIPKPAPVSPTSPIPSITPVAPVAPNISQPPTIPAASKAPAEPAPMMMAGTRFSSAPQKNSDFHLSNINSGAQVTFEQAKPQEKVMPAVIEFPKPTQTTPLRPSPSVPPTAAKGAIHYTEFAPTFKVAPAANSGARNVTEITSSAKPPLAPPIPMPPAAPKPVTFATTIVPPVQVPATPPKPPTPTPSASPTAPSPLAQQPPQPPKAKVITKDFL
jgi:hypothetical protein